MRNTGNDSGGTTSARQLSAKQPKLVVSRWNPAQKALHDRRAAMACYMNSRPFSYYKDKYT
jgi:hypothetical protein